MTTILVLLSAFITSFALHAEEDELQAQKTACAKNTAMEWSLDLNRCVGKAQSRQDRHDAQDCNAITDVEARKACHMNLATSKTGVTADANEAASKISSGQSRSTIVNTANAIVSGINFIAKDSAQNTCMSKQIMGITALGGFLTDIWMKINTKKKLDALNKKFILDGKENAYGSQVKALEYLKEEQEEIKKIASLEKKRQMLLMIGYGAAAAFAVYETMSPTGSTCYKKEEVKTQPKPEPPQPAPNPTPDTPKEAEVRPVDMGGKVEVRELDPLPAPAPAPAPTPVPDPECISCKPIPSPAPEPKSTLVQHTNGNTTYHTIEQDGKTVGVVYNKQVYPQFKNVNGMPMAMGSPSGNFNYSDASYSMGGQNYTVSDYSVHKASGVQETVKSAGKRGGFIKQ